jgi:hypothetical protein
MLPYRKRAIAALAVAYAITLVTAPAAILAQGTQNQQLSGIQVQLTSVAHTPTGSLLVKWTYHNTGAQAQTITDAGCYLEANGKKYPASVSSVPKSGVLVGANATLSAWAVVSADAGITTVTVHLNGAQPFKDVTVSGS